MVNKIQSFKYFLGNEVWSLFLKSIALGLAWFSVESTFVFILQGFLSSLGILDKAKAQLPDFYPTGLAASMTLLTVFGLCRFLVLFFKNYFNGAVNQAFVRHHRNIILTYALENSSILKSSDINAYFNEVVTKGGMVILVIAKLITNCTSALLFLSFGFYLAPLELIIGISLIATILIPLNFLNQKVKKYGAELVEASKSSNEILLGGMKHNFFLKIYNLVDSEIKKGKEVLFNYENLHKNYYLIHGLKTALPVFAGILVISIITYFSLTYLKTPGVTLLSFFYIFLRLVQTVSESMSAILTIKLNSEGLIQLSSIQKTFDKKSADKNKKEKHLAFESLPKIFSEKIEIKANSISFSYPGQDPLFKDISFEVNKGEVFLIKGESGSGKSTLASLLLNIASPSKGKISYNEIEQDSLPRTLSEFIGYVGPEPFMIPGSIKDNLLYGLPSHINVTEKDLWDVLGFVKISEAIQNLPAKLDTYLYESTQLSTGQKQRIAFARAILRNPKLLILDEATSNLDQKTEEIIISNLIETKERFTTIVISHKSSFDNTADKVINL